MMLSLLLCTMLSFQNPTLVNFNGGNGKILLYDHVAQTWQIADIDGQQIKNLKNILDRDSGMPNFDISRKDKLWVGVYNTNPQLYRIKMGEITTEDAPELAQLGAFLTSLGGAWQSLLNIDAERYLPKAKSQDPGGDDDDDIVQFSEDPSENYGVSALNKTLEKRITSYQTLMTKLKKVVEAIQTVEHIQIRYMDYVSLIESGVTASPPKFTENMAQSAHQDLSDHSSETLDDLFKLRQEVASLLEQVGKDSSTLGPLKLILNTELQPGYTEEDLYKLEALHDNFKRFFASEKVRLTPKPKEKEGSDKSSDDDDKKKKEIPFIFAISESFKQLGIQEIRPVKTKRDLKEFYEDKLSNAGEPGSETYITRVKELDKIVSDHTPNTKNPTFEELPNQIDIADYQNFVLSSLNYKKLADFQKGLLADVDNYMDFIQRVTDSNIQEKLDAAIAKKAAFIASTSLVASMKTLATKYADHKPEHVILVDKEPLRARWADIVTGKFTIKKDSRLKEVNALRSETTNAQGQDQPLQFKIKSTFAKSFDLSVALTQTEVTTPTYSVIDHPETEGEFVIGLEKESDTKATPALFFNWRFMDYFSPNKTYTIRPGLELGVGTESDQPLFLGLSLSLGKYFRIGYGRASHKIDGLLQPGQTPLIVNEDGTYNSDVPSVIKEYKIRTRSRALEGDYVSFGISIKSYQLFTKK